MTDRELMQQALELLDEATNYTSSQAFSPSMTRDIVKGVDALRERLAQPEQVPVAWVECDGDLVWNNREAAIGRNLYTTPPQPEQSRAEKMRDAGYTRRPTLREIASEDEQPQQELVAWFDKEFNSVRWRANLRNCDLADQQPLYTTPPRREWVGLTDEEIVELRHEIKVQLLGTYKTEDIYRAIEAKLKEKNA